MPVFNPKGRVNLSRLTVLAVDDHPLALQIVSRVLLGFGVGEMIHCSNAAEAKRVLESRPIDLVVTDGQMPDMDGYTLTKWLRGLEYAENRLVPILMLSGETRAAHIAKGRDAGASSVMAKPIRPQTLLERIFWLSQDNREFVETEGYFGPDRRFRTIEFGPGMVDRRLQIAFAGPSAEEESAA